MCIYHWYHDRRDRKEKGGVSRGGGGGGGRESVSPWRETLNPEGGPRVQNM